MKERRSKKDAYVTEANKRENRESAFNAMSRKLDCDSIDVAPEIEPGRDRNGLETLRIGSATIEFVNYQLKQSLIGHEREGIRQDLYQEEQRRGKKLPTDAGLVTYDIPVEELPEKHRWVLFGYVLELLKLQKHDLPKHNYCVVSALLRSRLSSDVTDEALHLADQEKNRIVTRRLDGGVSTTTSLASASSTVPSIHSFDNDGNEGPTKERGDRDRRVKIDHIDTAHFHNPTISQLKQNIKNVHADNHSTIFAGIGNQYDARFGDNNEGVQIGINNKGTVAANFNNEASASLSGYDLPDGEAPPLPPRGTGRAYHLPSRPASSTSQENWNSLTGRNVSVSHRSGSYATSDRPIAPSGYPTAYPQFASRQPALLATASESHNQAPNFGEYNDLGMNPAYNGVSVEARKSIEPYNNPLLTENEQRREEAAQIVQLELLDPDIRELHRIFQGDPSGDAPLRRWFGRIIKDRNEELDRLEQERQMRTLEGDNHSEATSSSRRSHKSSHSVRSQRTTSSSEGGRNHWENYWEPKTVTQARDDSPRFRAAFKPIKELNRERRYHKPGKNDPIWREDGDKPGWEDLNPRDMKPGDSDGLRFQRTAPDPAESDQSYSPTYSSIASSASRPSLTHPAREVNYYEASNSDQDADDEEENSSVGTYVSTGSRPPASRADRPSWAQTGWNVEAAQSGDIRPSSSHTHASGFSITPGRPTAPPATVKSSPGLGDKTYTAKEIWEKEKAHSIAAIKAEKNEAKAKHNRLQDKANKIPDNWRHHGEKNAAKAKAEKAKKIYQNLKDKLDKIEAPSPLSPLYEAAAELPASGSEKKLQSELFFVAKSEPVRLKSTVDTGYLNLRARKKTLQNVPIYDAKRALLRLKIKMDTYWLNLRTRKKMMKNAPIYEAKRALLRLKIKMSICYLNSLDRKKAIKRA